MQETYILAICILGVISIFLYLELRNLKNREPETDLSLENLVDEIISERDKYKDLAQVLTDKVYELEEKNKKVVSQKQSIATKFGQMSEHFLAFIDEFPYEAEKCNAMFQPIDLLYFGDDEIVFIELKTGNSSLSTKQRKIKTLVDSAKVRFDIVRLNEKGMK